MSCNKIIVIMGPTATGKTDLAIEVFKVLGKEHSAIINFDSLLFYRELNIGTAKPSAELLEKYPHYLINIQSAKEPLNASAFMLKAQQLIKELHALGRTPILVGGSGFYLRAILKGMYQDLGKVEEVDNGLEKLLQENGAEKIRQLLKDVDLESYQHLHPNDTYRNVRAYQYFLTNGKPFSAMKKEFDARNPYDLSLCIDPSWLVHSCYLDIPKEQHYSLIVQRTLKMLQMGLVQEVQALLQQGFTGTERPLQSIGYLQAQQFLRKEIEKEEDLAQAISIATRQLAKAQRTFFNKIQPKKSYNPLFQMDQILSDVIQFMK